MKLGYYVRTELNYPDIRDLTLRVEKMGFDSAHVNDHLIGFDEKQEKKEPYLEALMLMSALAAETEKIKLGHIVLCNSFRNPAYLAKSISTLDSISNGRALLWLGAGWYEEEYKAYGYPFPTPKRRVDELEESLTIIKKLFTEDSTDFEGQIWKLENSRNYPKPVQKPYPPIVLGTSGKRMTKIACREADGINLPYTKAEDLADKIKNIRELLSSFDRDPNKFEISLFTAINLIDSQEVLDSEVEKVIGRFKEEEKPTKEEVLRNHFIGYPEDIKEKIAQVSEVGIQRMVFTVRKSETIEDPLKLFREKVM
ncbi:MAG: LLM class flavin-dependent oxidoreductase [Candidatus Heimdallarchaeaceae archaeon]|jgi:alkanesulfonate monooxygenase SsuD/methylene tetrahydromethanopterin reductase-like flavin-dependent oxidoreductase (luciferase family)